jgi:hypothetical protein
VNPFSNFLALLFGSFVTVAGVTYTVVQSDKKISIVAEMHEVEMEKVKAEAERSIVMAENRVAEKFLMHGYAEEYKRYQELTKVKRKENVRSNELQIILKQPQHDCVSHLLGYVAVYQVSVVNLSLERGCV